MRSEKFQPALVVFAIVAIAALSGCAPAPHKMVGEPAPEVTLDLLGGGTFKLSDHRDEHIVILDFWATWCGPCRASMPIIARVAKDYKSKGVVLYTVNQAETKAEVRDFLTSIRLNCAVAMDVDMSAGQAYEAEFIPQTVLIDKTGRIQEIYVGSDSSLERELRRDLDALVAGKSLL